MADMADFTNQGGYNGEGLLEEEYVQPKMPKEGSYPTKRRPTVDFRDGWSTEEVMKDFYENGFY